MMIQENNKIVTAVAIIGILLLIAAMMIHQSSSKDFSERQKDWYYKEANNCADQGYGGVIIVHPRILQDGEVELNAVCIEVALAMGL